MALRAGYYGVKKKILDELEKLDGAKIIKSVGAGLSFNSSTGALSCKLATASQAGIAKSSDYLSADIVFSAPLVTVRDAETGELTNLGYANTGDLVSNTTIDLRAVDDAFILTETYDNYKRIVLMLGRNNANDGVQFYEVDFSLLASIGAKNILVPVRKYVDSPSPEYVTDYITLQLQEDNKTFKIVKTSGTIDHGIRNVIIYSY